MASDKLNVAPIAHPWTGAAGDLLTPFDADRLREAVEAALRHITIISAGLSTAFQVLNPSTDHRLQDLPRLVAGFRHLAVAGADLGVGIRALRREIKAQAVF